MKTLRDSTLVFLLKETGGNITDVCLAMKKRGFGRHRWNGVGGKVAAEKETIEAAARREAKEEIGVTVQGLSKVAELSFYFPHQPDWDQLVHVYFATEWEGKPSESEEMRPQWFRVKEIPFTEMWPDDIFWLPKVLAGERLQAEFSFGENDILQSTQVVAVNNFQT